MYNLDVSVIVSQSSCSGLSIAWLGFRIVLCFSTCSRVNTLLFFLWTAIALSHSSLCHFFSLTPCTFSSHALTWAFHGFNDLWTRCTLKLPQLLFLGCFSFQLFSSVDETLLPSLLPSTADLSNQVSQQCHDDPCFLSLNYYWSQRDGYLQLASWVVVLPSCCSCLCSSCSWSNRGCLVPLMCMDWGFNC